MFGRACRLTGLLLLGACLPESTRTFDALTENWSLSTLVVAEPAITAALMVSGLTSELCHLNITPDYWSTVSKGDTLPLSTELDSALGNPHIDSVVTDDSTQITLAGVRIIDRDNAFLRFSIAKSTDTYALNVYVLDGRNDVPFGQIQMSISETCEGSLTDSVWVSGEARWTDLTDLTHTVNLPADDGLSVGLNLNCGFVPSAGTLSWKGSINDQARSIETSDAAEIVFDAQATAKDTAASIGFGNCPRLSGHSAASWPSTIRGGSGDWEIERDLVVPIAP